MIPSIRDTYRDRWGLLVQCVADDVTAARRYVAGFYGPAYRLHHVATHGTEHTFGVSRDTERYRRRLFGRGGMLTW
jgi:propanediol dehydratase large subunit